MRDLAQRVLASVPPGSSLTAFNSTYLILLLLPLEFFGRRWRESQRRLPAAAAGRSISKARQKIIIIIRGVAFPKGALHCESNYVASMAAKGGGKSWCGPETKNEACAWAEHAASYRCSAVLGTRIYRSRPLTVLVAIQRLLCVRVVWFTCAGGWVTVLCSPMMLNN